MAGQELINSGVGGRRRTPRSSGLSSGAASRGLLASRSTLRWASRGMREVLCGESAIMSGTNTAFLSKLIWAALLFAACSFISSYSSGDETTRRPVRVGYLSQASQADSQEMLNVFRAQLRKLGYVEGKDIVIEPRWADGDVARLPSLATQLVEDKVDIIVTGGTPGALAAKKAASSIPIIAATMADPIRTGLVASLSRPGGNLTGMSMGYAEGLGGKWLELLEETVPQLATVAVLSNPDNPVHLYLVQDIESAASNRHLKVHAVEVWEARALKTAFADARKSAQAMILIADAVSLGHVDEVVALANLNRLPVVYGVRSFVPRGGLMAYAPDVETQYRRAAEMVDKVARGARPADLPIEQPNKYELLVNLKAAKALGLVIPRSVLVRADKTIE